ncbi:MAG: hypothetical protein OXN89_20575 [Bryobacterales bacterium]|nr:hypothetical protein [Bryobacterales bacterium]
MTWVTRSTRAGPDSLASSWLEEGTPSGALWKDRGCLGTASTGSVRVNLPWQAERDEVLAAEPPKKLSKKKSRGTSEGGLPLHSFQTLMAEMGTRTRNECRVSRDPKGPG